MEQLGSHKGIFMKFDIWTFLKNLSRKTVFTATTVAWTSLSIKSLPCYNMAEGASEDHWRYIWMCETGKGQQMAQMHDSFMMIRMMM
jgi:hypothetical protein